MGFIVKYEMNEGFGNTIYDVSGNSNHGTIYNALWANGVKENEKSLFFNGINSYVDLGTFSITSSSFSVVAWIKFIDFTNAQARIISKATSQNTPDHWLMISTNKPTSKHQFRFRLKIDETTEIVYESGSDYIENYLNEWLLITWTFNSLNGQWKFYKNKTLIDDIVKSGSISIDNTVSVFLGANPPLITDVFHGNIESLFIYDHALTLSQIKNIFNNKFIFEDDNKRRLLELKHKFK